MFGSPFKTIQNVSDEIQDFHLHPCIEWTSQVGNCKDLSLRSLRPFSATPAVKTPNLYLRKSLTTMENTLEATFSKPTQRTSAVLAIAVGGLTAGTLDLTQACILFGWDIPLSIAGGLLGRQAVHGGAGTYILGVLLHYFIACSAATTYYAASRKLRFLAEHPLICGLFFGAAVEEVMNLIVLPLSALHARGPYELHDLILGLVVHMIVIGLPIAYSVRRFS